MFDYPAETTAPACCFLCERAPEPGENFAAPGYVFEPDFPHKLYGTKLVCDNCIGALAEHRGYHGEPEIERLGADVEAALKERDALQAQLDEGVAGLVKLLDERKPKPVRKPVAKKESFTLEH